MKIPFALMIVFGGAVAAIPASADDHAITSGGSAVISAAPDTAIVMLGVVTSGATVADALHDNNDRMTRVLAAIHVLGIKDSQIHTWNFSVQPKHPKNEYGYDYDQTVGYIITNKIEISVSDLGKVAKVVDAAFVAGANVLDSVNFSVKNNAALQDQALGEAVKNARRRATLMAAAEGAEVGKLLSVSNVERGIVRGGDMQSVPIAITEGSLITPILPGSISVSAQVTATYEIK
jgi:uncharacterized protein YggE